VHEHERRAVAAASMIGTGHGVCTAFLRR
jgi:hypothetical protein